MVDVLIRVNGNLDCISMANDRSSMDPGKYHECNWGSSHELSTALGMQIMALFVLGPCSALVFMQTRRSEPLDAFENTRPPH